MLEAQGNPSEAEAEYQNALAVYEELATKVEAFIRADAATDGTTD